MLTWKFKLTAEYVDWCGVFLNWINNFEFKLLVFDYIKYLEKKYHLQFYLTRINFFTKYMCSIQNKKNKIQILAELTCFVSQNIMFIQFNIKK